MCCLLILICARGSRDQRFPWEDGRGGRGGVPYAMQVQFKQLRCLLPADEMGVSLLLVGQSVEVLLDLQPNNRGRGIGQILT